MRYTEDDEMVINELLDERSELEQKFKNKLISLLKENGGEILIDPKNVTEEDTYESTFVSWDRHDNYHINVFLGAKLVGNNIVLLGVDNDEFEVGETPEKIKEITPGYYNDNELHCILRIISGYFYTGDN